jgi:hypothetical protein
MTRLATHDNMSLLNMVIDRSDAAVDGADPEHGEADELLRRQSPDSLESDDPPSVYRSIHR